MKRIIMISMAMMVSVLSACGGGGDTAAVAPAPAGITYTGAVTPASITTINANALAGNVSGNTNAATALAVGATVSSAKRSNVTRHLPQLGGLTRKLVVQGRSAAAVATGAIVAINSTQAGPAGGSVTLTGQVDDVLGTGSITATFSNYVDVGNVVMNGSMTISVLAFDALAGVPVDMSLTLNNLSVSDAVSSLSMSGSMRDQVRLTANREILTVNFVAQDNISLHQVRLQNFIIDEVFDNINFPTTSNTIVSGRVFDSVEGYVDIVTTVPMIVSNLSTDQYPSIGSMVFTGSVGAFGATAVRVTAQSAVNVLVEADTTGDGIYDYSSGIIAWTAL